MQLLSDMIPTPPVPSPVVLGTPLHVFTTIDTTFGGMYFRIIDTLLHGGSIRQRQVFGTIARKKEEKRMIHVLILNVLAHEPLCSEVETVEKKLRPISITMAILDSNDAPIQI
jgi:hypothetical protein